MMRTARLEDLGQIMIIVGETIEDLNSEKNLQWSETYPTLQHFTEDIKNNDLFIYEQDSKVAGFICLNQKEDQAYEGLNWQKNTPAIVIHRFAVKRSNQRQSIGSKLIEYTESYAKNKNFNYIKVDTNSQNTKMNKLFKKHHFNFVDTIHLRDLVDKFNCYDKVLERGE